MNMWVWSVRRLVAGCGENRTQKKKGQDCYALHYCFNFGHIVATGIGHFHHHGRLYSHTSGAGHCGCLAQGH